MATQKQRTTKLLADLKQLSKSAHENIWKRLELAQQILADRDWVESVYGGDVALAQDKLQHEHFFELSGAMPLGLLLQIKSDIPDEKIWREQRYNLQDMRALWTREFKEQAEAPTRQRVTRKEYEEVVKELERVRARNEAMAEENARLRKDLQDAVSKIANLEGQIAALKDVSAAA